MTQTQVERSRTFSWSDPATNAALIGKTSGLSLLQAMIAGELPPPPVMHLLGMTRLTAEEGRVTVEMPPREYHYNPLGTVHGGVLATLLDTAAGCAVHTTLPAGVGYTSLGLEAKYVRPITRDTGRVLCEANVVYKGRRQATAEANLTAADSGKLLAHGVATCMILGGD
jgi:uncharacterized protein (TIGR00369 family)